MDEEFGPAALAIYAGEVDALADMLKEDRGLATRTSSCSHPTLLQLVACEEPDVADPVGAARTLVDAGAHTHSPLVAAAGCASRAVLEFLLDSGVDVNGEDPRWSPLDEALYWAQSAIAGFLVGRDARIRALSTAAGLGDPAAIEGFFEGATVGARAGPIGSPFPDTVPPELATDAGSIVDHAFVMAVNTGRREAAELLVGRGAQVNAKPPGYHWQGTALHAAVWRGDQELVEWLVDQGANAAIRDGLANSDAIGWASHHKHPELVALLTGEAAGG